MKTRALLLVLPLLALGSCTRPNHASVEIQQICFPSNDCTFSAKCDKVLIGRTVIDTSVVHDATLFLQVNNNLPDNSSSDAGQLNTNFAHVNYVSIAYDQVALPTDNYYVSNWGIPTEGSSVFAVDVVRGLSQNVPILDAAVAAGGGFATVVAKVKLRGYFDDGSTFETGDFTTGVDLCSGCLPQPACAAGQAACPFEGMEPVACGTVQ